MNILQAIILGIVEGVTEFLPVSSTGHLILSASALGLGDDPGEKAALDAYFVVIQGASLLAIIGLYWSRMMQMLRGILGRDPAGLKLFTHLIIAFLPALILWPLLIGLSQKYLFRPVPVLAALFLGGVWMIWLGWRWKKQRAEQGDDPPGLTIEDMTWKHALGIGVFQFFSIWPGTSRAMMTIAGGVMLRMKPAQAAEFSFLLGLPTIAAATVYSLGKDYLDTRDGESLGMFQQIGLVPALVGMIVTIISAAITVKWLIGFLNRHSLAAFGWYRIALCIVFGSLLFTGLVELW